MATIVAPNPITTSFPNGAIIFDWPEPIQPVQILAESGAKDIPSQYVRPESERATLLSPLATSPTPSILLSHEDRELHIPIIDLSGLAGDAKQRRLTLAEIEHACEEWGFFQAINHGVPQALIENTKHVARQFFDMPLKEKQAYANNPSTYEGYGSRLGIEKEAILDWSDYFYLNVFPITARDMSKWPTTPSAWRETIEEYCEHVLKLSEILLEAMSISLGLNPRALKEAFGGDEKFSVSQRINFYPSCPQPDLTLGLSPHSDPGGITILLQDDQVSGLQVHYEGEWVDVKPIPGALVINLADQIQILTNGRFKSVEHRVAVTCDQTRLSIATFCNPSNDLVISPLKELASEDNGPLYSPMTFREYRSFIRRIGTKGKEFLTYAQSPKHAS